MMDDLGVAFLDPTLQDTEFCFNLGLADISISEEVVTSPAPVLT